MTDPVPLGPPAAMQHSFAKAVRAVQQSTLPSLLSNLKTISGQRGQTPKTLNLLTQIPLARIRALANAVRQEEPYLDEACALARVLGLSGILPLMTSGDLTACNKGVALDSDVAAFRAGARMPLSMACRVALTFGLDDPIQLVVPAEHMQLWSVLEKNERSAAPGECPWCRERGSHHPMCLPDNLWGARNIGSLEELGHIPRARGVNSTRRGFSKRAHGVKPLRAQVHMTQEQFGERCGMTGDYLAKIERGDLPLTLDKAEKIAAAFRVDVASLYAGGEEEG